MKNENVIKSISKHGNGEIYLGVVGAVRSGKSTFIKRVIEKIVIPNTTSEYEKQKCLDEMPQSGQGKTIMTTEPKFVPSSGATIKINDFKTNIKLVDCVGYVINDSNGFLDENGNPRMVKSPWFDDYIPLTEAAEIGTQKVIKDHATIAIVVTSDGTITDIKRENYVEAENRVITELKEIGKPFIVILNSKNPSSIETRGIASSLSEEYDVPVLTKSVDEMNEDDIEEILQTALNEFPIENLKINIPKWVSILPNNSEIKINTLNLIKENILNINKLKDADNIVDLFTNNEIISKCYISSLDADTGTVTINLDLHESLFEEELNKYTQDEKLTKSFIMQMFISGKGNNNQKNINNAIKMAKNTGYGIVYPNISDMKLETPEITKQGNRYGVRLKATASSIHMIKVDVTSSFEPIIGSEAQAKELVDYIMKDAETDKESIWKSEIFGRSLEQIVKEGIESKLISMPDTTRLKLSSTVTKIVNKGANNLIAIVI